MDPARWDRMQTLFHRAADLDEPERSAFLRDACGDDQYLLSGVIGMIEEDGRASLLDRDVVEVANHVLADDLSPSLAISFKDFSPYRIKNVLGEGGMGVVYLAERKDLGNLVAIKILREAWLSPSRRERFTAEQRTLAQLNHPSIARLYDANTLPDGTPWFVMEYVDGLPITDYCSRNHCSADERLKLIREVAEAVQYAHDHGVIHRDLKPSNILVKKDGSVRLLDFGIAKQLDPEGRPVNQTRTDFRPMTPAYASPEQLRGEPVSRATDVYSLGVVFYELLAGKLPFDLSHKTAAEVEAIITAGEATKPSSIDAGTAGIRGKRSRVRRSGANLDALCLTAMHKDPRRRYSSAAALIRDIDHHLNREPLEARTDSISSSLASFVRRSIATRSAAIAVLALLALVATVASTLTFSRKTALLPPKSRTVAVLPLRNSGAVPSLDYLSRALTEEISRTLGYARSLSLRPPETARKFTGANVDLQAAGRELRVSTIVSGHFLKAGDQLQITLEATDVESNRRLWSDVFDVPAQNMVAMQAQIAAKTRRGMAPALGIAEFVTDKPPKPNNEEAYQLYLRAQVAGSDGSTDPEAGKQAIEVLDRSVALDPYYAPAWEALASWYAVEGWFGNGGEAAMARWRALADKIVALDPDNIIFRANLLYIGSLGGHGPEDGRMSRGQAYRGLEDLLRRRPDSARLHFLVSWMLRDTGLLDESARECETSVLIDAQDAGARSCGVTFMLRGDYSRALDYLHLDPDSEVSKAVSIDVLLREGREKEVLQLGKVPQWGGYGMLMAYLQHRSAAEIAALARDLQPTPDPEVNYFSAAHLAYTGQNDAALAMLKRTVEGGYCSYPAVDSDPLFRNLRAKAEFKEIRSAALECQNSFLAQRRQAPKP
jgi:serine/threonine protein kinase